MPKFNREQFLAANNADPFEKVPAGVYIVNIAEAYYNKAKSSGRLQVTFKYVVDDQDAEVPGKEIWEHIGFTKDGEQDNKGCARFLSRCRVLGLDDVDRMADEIEYFFGNPDTPRSKGLELLIGTQLRLKVAPGKGDFQNFSVVNLVNSSIEEDDEVEREVANEAPFEAPASPASTAAHNGLPNGLAVGMRVSIASKSGGEPILAKLIWAEGEKAKVEIEATGKVATTDVARMTPYVAAVATDTEDDI